ncbi:MAG: LEPR-XLL domain-containing protein [Oceanospirillaceae bacterium]
MKNNNNANSVKSYQLEILEERILLSADPLLTVNNDSETQATQPRSEVLVVAKLNEDDTATGTADSSFAGMDKQPLVNIASPSDNLSIDGKLLQKSNLDLVIKQEQTLSGNGVITAHVTVNGEVGPGNSPGIIEFTDGVDYSESSNLIIEIGGVGSSEYDQVKVSGTATLAGKLSIEIIAGFELSDGDTFSIMTYDTVDGKFTSADGLFSADYDDGAGYFEIEQGDNSLDLVYRKLSDGLKIAFAQTDDNNAFGEILNIDYFNNPDIPLSIDTQARIQYQDNVSFQGIVQIKGGIATDLVIAPGFPAALTDLPAELRDYQSTYFTLSITNGSGFIGTGGPAEVDLNFDGDTDDLNEKNAGAKGIAIQDATVGIVYFNQVTKIDLSSTDGALTTALPNFFALKATTGEIKTVGYEDLLSIRAQSASFNINTADSWLPLSAPAIDFKESFAGKGLEISSAGGEPFIIDFDAVQTQSASFNNASMSVLDYVHVYGDLTLIQGNPKEVTISTGLPATLAQNPLLQPIADALLQYTGGDDTSSIQDVEIDGFEISGENLKAFIGVNGGYDQDGVMLNSAAKGLEMSDMRFGYLSMAPTSPILESIIGSFTALTATATASKLIGFDDDQLKLEADTIQININDGQEWPGGFGPPVIDFAASFAAEVEDDDGDGKIDPAGYEISTGSDPIYITFDGNQRLGADLIGAQLSILDFVHVYGNLHIEKGPASNVNIATGFPADIVNLLDGGLPGVSSELKGLISGLDDYSLISQAEVTGLQIGGSNLNGFVGVDGSFNDEGVLASSAKGLSFSDMEFAYTQLDPTDPILAKLLSFEALTATAQSIEVVGMEGVTVQASNIAININNGDAWPGGFGPPVIDFASSFPEESIDGETIPIGYEVNVGNDPVYISHDGNQRIAASLDNALINFADFVIAKGNFSFLKGPTHTVTVNTGIPSDLSGFADLVSIPSQIELEVDSLVIAASDVSVFAGIGGSNINLQGDGTLGVNAGATGILLDNVDLAYASFTPTLAAIPGLGSLIPKFQVLKVTADSAKFVGIGAPVSVTGITIDFNNGTKWPGTNLVPTIDFSESDFGNDVGYIVEVGESAASNITFDYDSALLRIGIEYAELKISDALVLSGGFVIEKGNTATIEVNSRLEDIKDKLVDANVLNSDNKDDFKLSTEVEILTIGVNDANLIAHMGVVDVELKNANVALFIATPTIASIASGLDSLVPKFIALKANATGAKIDASESGPIEISALKSVELEANFAYFPSLDPIVQTAIFALGAPAINFRKSFDDEKYVVQTANSDGSSSTIDANSIELDFQGQSFKLAIEEATVKLYNPLDAGDANKTAVLSLEGGLAINRISGQTVTLTDGSTRENVEGITFAGKALKASIGLGALDLDLGAEAEVGVALMRSGLDYYLAIESEIEAEAGAAAPELAGFEVELKNLAVNVNTKLNYSFTDVTGGGIPAAIDFARSYNGESVTGVDLDGNGRIDQTGMLLTTSKNATENTAILLNYDSQLLSTRGQAKFTVNDFPGIALEGSYEATITGDVSTVFFDGQLSVGYGDKALEFNTKGVLYSKILKDADGKITGNEAAIKLLTQGGFEIPGVIAFDANLEFLLNTSGHEVIVAVPEDFDLGYTQVIIGGAAATLDSVASSASAYFTLKAVDGTLTLVDAFSIDGGVLISGSLSGLNLEVAGKIGLLGLGNLTANGKIALNDNGIITDLKLVGEANILELITIGGDLIFHVDTIGGSPSIELKVDSPRIGLLGLINLNPGGSITLGFDNGVFKVGTISANASFGGISTAVTSHYFDSLGNLKFSFGFSVGGGIDVGILSASASVSAKLTVIRSNGELNLLSQLSGSASAGSDAVRVDTPFGSVEIFPEIRESGSLSVNLIDISHDPDSGNLGIDIDVFGLVTIPINIGFKLKFPDSPPPNVATKSGNTITVNVGSKSSLRNYDQAVSDEKIKISQSGSTLTVNVQGKITVLEGVGANSEIVIDAGSGGDKVLIASSVTGKVIILNAESVDYRGSGIAYITGSSAVDSIALKGTGSANVDSLGGNDHILLNGSGVYNIIAGSGDDVIESNMITGTSNIIFKEGFGNDSFTGLGLISKIDMSALVNRIALEYDYKAGVLSMSSLAGSLSTSSSNVPQIQEISFGTGDDEYVITQASSIKLTDAGGENTFYYVVPNGGDAHFNGNQFVLNANTVIFSSYVSSFYFGNIEYQKNSSNGRFNGVSSHRLSSGTATLSMSASSDYDFGVTKVEINANNFDLNNSFSASEWLINIEEKVGIKANLIATIKGITLNQTVDSGEVIISANVSAELGAIEINAAGNVKQTAGDITTKTTREEIEINSTAGSFIQTNGSHVITNDSDITIAVNNDIEVANLNAKSADITLTANTGGIIDSGDTDLDIQAAKLSFTSNLGFGVDVNDIDTRIDEVSGVVARGTINLQELDGLSIIEQGLKVTSNGNILINNQSSDIDVNAAVDVALAGYILINAQSGTLNINADIATNSDKTISLQAQNDINQAANKMISSVNGTVDILAAANIAQADGAEISVGSIGDVRLEAGDSIELAAINAGEGTVSIVTQTGSVIDAGDSHVDVIAANLRMDVHADIGELGSEVNALELEVNTFTANTETGSISILEADALNIDTVSLTIERVNSDATTSTITDAAQSDLVAKTEGDIVVQTTAGDINVNDGVNINDTGVDAQGSGDVLLRSLGAGTSVNLNVDVKGGTGNISVIAANDVNQNNTADISTDAGNVDVEATTGNITQSTTARIYTGENGGDIRVQAATNVEISGLHAGTGNVSIIAQSGKVIDADSIDSDHYKDVEAAGLRINAQQDIGALGALLNPLEIAVDDVSALSQVGEISLLEDDAINVDSVSVSVNRINTDGSSTQVIDVAQSDLVTNTDGSIVLQTLAGNLTVNDGVDNAGVGVTANGSGNVLLASIGASSSVIINSDVQSATGHISVSATQDVMQTDHADLLTQNGSVEITALQGSITQADTARASTGDGTGNIRLHAQQDVEVGGLHTGGDVSITTVTGSVIDSGDHYKDVEAKTLRIDAGVGAGLADAIDTSVDTLAARAANGGINVHEDHNIEVNTIAQSSVERVNNDGSTTTITNALMSDLVTSDNGSISLDTIDGTITIFDGQAADDGIGISANGEGNVSIDAHGAGQDVVLKEDTDILSDAGDIHILAEDAVLQESASDIIVSNNGNIEVIAETGSIYMTDGTRANVAGTGNIFYQAKIDVDLSRLIGEAHVIVIADTGQIRDNLEIGAGNIDYRSKIDPAVNRSVSTLLDTVVIRGATHFNGFKIGELLNEQSNIEARTLSLVANQGIGILNIQDIDIEVTEVEMVNKSDNHIFVQEKDSVNIFGYGARNYNQTGALMFSTITGELSINNKDFRNRDEVYASANQKVTAYKINDYSIRDFYLSEGTRIVNDKLHTGIDGFLYVRSAIGDWGPMNYDQLADELSRIRSVEREKLRVAELENKKGVNESEVNRRRGFIFNEVSATDVSSENDTRLNNSLHEEQDVQQAPSELLVSLNLENIQLTLSYLAENTLAANEAEQTDGQSKQIGMLKLLLKNEAPGQNVSVQELFELYIKLIDSYDVGTMNFQEFLQLFSKVKSPKVV